MPPIDFDAVVTLALRDPDHPGTPSRTVFVGSLRIALTLALALPGQARGGVVIFGPGLPEAGLPPPGFDEIAALAGFTA